MWELGGWDKIPCGDGAGTARGCGFAGVCSSPGVGRGWAVFAAPLSSPAPPALDCALPAAARVPSARALSPRPQPGGSPSYPLSPTCAAAAPAPRVPGGARLSWRRSQPWLTARTSNQRPPLQTRPLGGTVQGRVRHELLVPACRAWETRRRRHSGARGMVGSVGGRRRQCPVQPGHPRTPARRHGVCRSVLRPTSSGIEAIRCGLLIWRFVICIFCGLDV